MLVYVFEFFSWKIDAHVSAVDTRLSDTRLLEVIQLIRSIPLPASQESLPETQTIEEVSEIVSLTVFIFNLCHSYLHPKAQYLRQILRKHIKRLKI
jgi:hypothetical protein